MDAIINQKIHESKEAKAPASARPTVPTISEPTVKTVTTSPQGPTATFGKPTLGVQAVASAPSKNTTGGDGSLGAPFALIDMDDPEMVVLQTNLTFILSC